MKWTPVNDSTPREHPEPNKPPMASVQVGEMRTLRERRLEAAREDFRKRGVSLRRILREALAAGDSPDGAFRSLVECEERYFRGLVEALADEVVRA